MGTVLYELATAADKPYAHITVRHSGKFNAMSRAMWLQLRTILTDVQQQTRNVNPLRCVVLQGADGHFCAGADIAEFPSFRFNAQSLRAFHEEDVWGVLQALLALDCPIIAAIDGYCMGAGLEMSSCCDIRLATRNSRYGAPIAKLGFPMAWHEAEVVRRAVGDTCARSILLEAASYTAPEMLQNGFLTRMVEDAAALQTECQRTVERICQLGAACTRMNKQTLRALNNAAYTTEQQSAAYAYADSAEHREGITAFLEKRPPRF